MTKSVLERAKAFLCWDAFPGLSIQLVAMREAVSYYYPPAERSSIVVFYDARCSDFTRPAFHLFHEAGHHADFIGARAAKREEDFREALDAPTGRERVRLEEEAWRQGRLLLKRFLRKEDLDPDLLKEYDAYASESIQTYEENASADEDLR